MKIERDYRQFKKSRLGSRLQRYFTFFSIVPILIFSIPLCIYMLNYTLGGIRDSTIDNLNVFSDELDLLLEDAYQIGNSISKNPSVQQYLKHIYNNDIERYFDETLLNAELVQLLQYSSDNIDVYILGNNSGIFKSTDSSIKPGLFKEQGLFSDITKISKPKWYFPHNGSLVAESLAEVHCALVLPVSEVFETANLGVIFVDITIQQSLYKSIVESASLFLINDDETIFFNNHDSVVYRQSDTLPEKMKRIRKDIKYWNIPQGIFSHFVQEDQSNITVYRLSEITGWVYCNTVPKNSTLLTLIIIILITALIIIFLILLSFILSFRVSKSFTDPILNLSKTMALVRKGDFSARSEYNGDDEIADLSRDFNTMVFDITKLMDKIYEEQNRIKQYELMLLQAQINPHFLYNTLDSIIWLIRMKENANSIKMIQSLTSFLRTGLNNGKEIINLQKEIENVKSYLIIQELRYKKKLSYEIDFPDEVLTQSLPKLILQPLVENAIYHGIKNNENGGFVHIYGYQDKKDIIIIVSDDGAGMSIEKQNELNRTSDNTEEENYTSYGFKNVKERLYLFFKERFSINVESKVNSGTTITLRIHGEHQDV